MDGMDRAWNGVRASVGRGGGKDENGAEKPPLAAAIVPLLPPPAPPEADEGVEMPFAVTVGVAGSSGWWWAALAGLVSISRTAATSLVVSAGGKLPRSNELTTCMAAKLLNHSDEL